MRLTAILLLLAPALFLAWWHVFRWGGKLGRVHWTAGRAAALVLLLAYAAWVLQVDREMLAIMLGSGGGRRTRFVPLLAFFMPGAGAGIAMYPQAAASLSPWYPRLLQWGMTKDFAVLGWGLMGISALVVWFVLMALR